MFIVLFPHPGFISISVFQFIQQVSIVVPNDPFTMFFTVFVTGNRNLNSMLVVHHPFAMHQVVFVRTNFVYMSVFEINGRLSMFLTILNFHFAFYRILGIKANISPGKFFRIRIKNSVNFFDFLCFCYSDYQSQKSY